MSNADEIYTELMEGLTTGLDYDGLRLKWEKSKGPFYNALQKVFVGANSHLMTLASQRKDAEAKTEEAQKELVALKGECKKAADELVDRNKKIDDLKQEAALIKNAIARTNEQLTPQKQMLEQLKELQKLGLQHDHLVKLHDVPAGIGSKAGLKSQEAIGKFFGDLKDYEAKAGFEHELKRLTTIADTKRLEADRWQAEKGALERKCQELKETLIAVRGLLNHGIKAEEIICWAEILGKCGGAEALRKELGKYESLSEVITVKEKESKACELAEQRLSGQIAALEEKRAQIEGGIESLSTKGLEEITSVKREATTEISSLIQKLAQELDKVTQASA